MKRLLALLALALPLAAQTTMRLRVGDPVIVTNITANTPIRLHGANTFSNGDQLICHTFQGHQNINSNLTPGVVAVRKVVNVTSTTFDLTDDADVNIAPSAGAVLVDINNAQAGNQLGYCGKVQTVTFRSSRPYLIPPTGTAWRTNVDDPDGTSSLQAPTATNNSAVWSGLDTFLSTYTTSGCDGSTAGTCTQEESRVNGVPFTSSSLDHTAEGSTILDTVIRWYTSKQDTRYLNSSKYYLQELHRWFSSGAGFNCAEMGSNCGRGSNNDWSSITAKSVAAAYDLVRSDLSAGQRSTLADKMLNGVSGTCTNPGSNTSGAIKYRTGDTVVTGSGFSGYAAKDIIYLAAAPVAKVNDGTLPSIACVSNVCTANFDRAHGMGPVGRYVKISGEAALNGNYPVASVTTNALTFAKTISDATYTTAGMEITPFVYGIGSTGSYVKIASVQSDTQMTLTQATSGDAINRPHAKANGWTAGNCGWAWYQPHSDDTTPPPWNRRAIFTLENAVSTTDTVFKFTTSTWPNVPPGTGWMARTPIQCATNCEYVVATSRNDANREITFTRGVLGYPQFAWGANTVFILARAGYGSTYSTYLSTSNGVFWTGNWSSNRQFVHNIAGWLVGLAFAQDDTRAVALAEMQFAFLRDTLIPHVRDHWTSLTQSSSSTDYNQGRLMTDYSKMIAAYENAFTTTPENLKGPTQNLAYWPLYLTLPWSWSTTWNYSDSASQGVQEQNDTYWVALQNYLQSGTSQVENLNYWFHNLSGFASGWTSQSPNRVSPFFLIYKNFASDTKTDFRSGGGLLPTYRFMTSSETGGATKQYGAFVSKSSWNTNATGLFCIGVSDPHDDHLGAYNLPGACRIASNVHLIDTTVQGGAGGTDANFQPGLFRVDSNTGGLKNPTTVPGIGGSTTWDLQYGSNTARYFRLNTSARWISTPLRSMVHAVHVIDTATGNNIIVRYDDLETSSSALRIVQMPYYKYYQPAAGGSHQVQNPAVTFSRSGADITHRSNQFSTSLLSKVLLPTNTTLISDSSTAIVNNVRITETTTASEALVLHQIVQDTTSTLPATALVTSNSNWRAVEFAHASTPFVVAIAKTGTTYNSTDFTTTHSGTARYVIAGLTAGTYTVNRGGSDILTNQNVVAGQSVLEFTSVSGAFIITQAGAPPPVQITTPTMPGGTVGVSYGTQSINVTGGTSPYTCALAPGSPAMCGGLTVNSACTITGTPTTAETCTPIVRATDSATPTPGTDDQQYSIVVAPAATPLTIDPGATTFPTGTWGNSFSHTWTAAGGTPGYTFAITAPGALPTGITHSAGVVSGTPTELGDFPIEMCVTDSASASACGTITYRVRPPITNTITITGKPHATGVLLALTKQGLNANKTCALIMRDQDEDAVQVIPIPGGPQFRVQPVTSLQSGRFYTAELNCDTFTASYQFFTEVATIPGQTLRYSRTPPPNLAGVDNIQVKWGPTSATLTNNTSQSCPTGCTVPLTGISQHELVYIQHIWRNSSNGELLASPIEPYVP